MDEARAVRGRERVADLRADRDRLRGSDGPVLEARVECLALEQLHDEECVGPVPADVEHLHDARMAKGRRALCLVEETIESRLVLSLGEDLDGHGALELLVDRAVDDPHSTAPDRGLEAIAIGEHARLTHRWPQDTPLLAETNTLAATIGANRRK